MCTSTESNSNRLYQLIRTIRDRAQFDHPTGKFGIIETHISYILLTGHYAYKFKKPLDLGFLDFTSLERRKFYCEEEIRLNRRLAPDLYIAVVPVTGSEQHPVIGGNKQALEYAVKMVQFPEEAELDRIVNTGCLATSHINELAMQIATFHGSVAVDTEQNHFGSPECIRQQVMLNYSAIRPFIQNDQQSRNRLDKLEAWTNLTLDQSAGIFRSRKQSGCIRECHGDLHLGNIALYMDKLVIFDSIEFSQALRWIDVMSEVAFLVMDLDAHHQNSLAQRFLNANLQITGDYNGLLLLRFYQVYRALIRSKVACIRLSQPGMTQYDQDKEMENCRRYLNLAYDYIQPVRTPLIITHGLSGSGKTRLSQLLLENRGAIRIRADVERKRMHGLRENDKTRSAVSSGIYSETSSINTYKRLAELARLVLNAGYPVIIDAAFLQRKQRLIFYNIAVECGVPFLILDLLADETRLRERIMERNRKETDASEADPNVLDYQIATQEPLETAETTHRIIINTSYKLDLPAILYQIHEKIKQE
ncbi:MAG: hypothetical protein A2W28_01190 [Gammaproteobacteria bacterium RBG_16_51_14]|nr:MAG: hypothetical protein A2W28_01190 [Gammaproteobacteria bacterium RBG_16_51_14]